MFWRLKMKIVQTSAAVFICSSSIAFAGGFELQTLDTSAMYENGGFASFSTAKLNSKLYGVGANGQKVKTLRDQSFSNIALKADVGAFNLGFATYRSGAIQMSGSSDGTFTGSYAPSANANLDTIAFMARYPVGDNFSVLGGVKQNNLDSFNLTSIFGSYDIKAAANTSYILGAAFSMPEIALRAEVLFQPSSKITTSGAYTSAALVMPGLNLPAGIAGSVAATLKMPEMLTINFQTGIAKDTLLTASIHQAKWGSSQVTANVTSGNAGVDAVAAVTSAFSDSTRYSIGLGRKFTDNLSGSISYSQEDGSGSTSKSSFSMSNGSKAISAGLKYSLEKMDISFGVSHTMFNDITVNAITPNLSYRNNSATTMGFKISTNF